MKPVTFLTIGGALAVAGLVWQMPSDAPPTGNAPAGSAPATIGSTPSIGGAQAPDTAQAEPRIMASRLFIGRDSFPPESFAAYGVLAFQTLATNEDEARYVAICEAFFTVLADATGMAAEPDVQMVTVWPIDDRDDPALPETLNATRAQDGDCGKAVRFHDIEVARDAILDARNAGVSLSGRGPFLLAWAPAARKGAADAVVLSADLSSVRNAVEAQDVLRVWRDEIEGDSALWQSGFTPEKMRIKARQILNRYGNDFAKFFGG